MQGRFHAIRSAAATPFHLHQAAVPPTIGGGRAHEQRLRISSCYEAITGGATIRDKMRTGARSSPGGQEGGDWGVGHPALRGKRAVSDTDPMLYLDARGVKAKLIL